LPDAVVARIHAVGYAGRDDRGSEYEIYFAPSIGCEPVRFNMLTRGRFGWPIAKFERTVDSYELGPPSADLFAVPAGYRQVPWEDLMKALNSAPSRIQRALAGF
jgi:hypothetical protein